MPPNPKEGRVKNKKLEALVANVIDDGVKMLGQKSADNEYHCGCAVALGAYLKGQIPLVLEHSDVKL